jgi:cytochrome c5
VRHVYANRATAILAVLLVLAAGIFASLRSEGLVLVGVLDEARLATLDDQEPREETEWAALGEDTWQERCHSCHASLPHVPELFGRDDGPRYLVELLLFGADGEIEVQGETRRLAHRPFADLDDEAIAAVINHMVVSEADDPPPEEDLLGADDVAPVRERELGRREVVERRP